MNNPRFEFKRNEKGKYGLYDCKINDWIGDDVYDDVKKPIGRNGQSTLGVLFNRLVCLKGKWGIFSIHPNQLSIKIKCEYEEILYDYFYGAGGWLLRKGDKWGVCSLDDKQIIIPCEYDLIETAPFAWLLNKDGHWGLYDVKKKAFTLPCSYDKLIVTEHECKMLNGTIWQSFNRL
jgi:hypothetical protein